MRSTHLLKGCKRGAVEDAIKMTAVHASEIAHVKIYCAFSTHRFQDKVRYRRRLALKPHADSGPRSIRRFHKRNCKCQLNRANFTRKAIHKSEMGDLESCLTPGY